MAAKKTKFTLSSYEPVTVTVPNYEATEDEAMQEMLRMVSARSTTVAIEPREIHPRDIVYVKMNCMESTTDRGLVPFPGLSTNGRVIRLGRGEMPEEFEKQLVKMKVGKEARIEFNVPDLAVDENGKDIDVPAVADVTVLEIREEIVPEITDEWVKEHYPSCDTMEELKDRARRHVTSRKLQQYLGLAPTAVTAQIATRLNEHIPDEMFEEQLRVNNASFDQFLRQQGMSRAEYYEIHRVDEERHNMQMMMETRQMIAEAVSVMAYAEHIGIQAREVDIDALVGGQTAQEITMGRQKAEEQGMMGELRDAARRGRACEDLMRNAKYVFADGTEASKFKQDLIIALDQQEQFKQQNASYRSRMADQRGEDITGGGAAGKR